MKKMGKEVIGIIAANNIRISPYIFFYTNILESLKVKYELIYPDRNNYIDSFSGKAYKIEWNNKIPSAVNYALYARKVINIVNRRKYSKLIVLTSINATYLSLWLKRKYNRKFVVDIRDYTYENLIPYAFLEKIAFNAAGLRIISSERFKEFLPNNMDYLVCHNISIDSETRPDKWKKQHGIITIGYIGSVAYAENVGKLIKLVRNDKRFKFHIYGGGPAQVKIQQMVRDANCDRISYFGPYTPKDKKIILSKVDVLFNAYGNNSMLLLCALSNKLYDGMFYRKIIINSPGTYMEKISGICGFSIDLDKKESLQLFYTYYHSLNEEEVSDYQDHSIITFYKENQETENKIGQYICSDII